MKERSNLYPYLIKHRLRYIKGFFFLIIINLLQIMVPKITGNIVDGLETMTMDEGQLLYYAGILMIISLMAFLSHYLSRVQVMGASNLFDYEVRNEMFSHLLSLSARFFHNNRIGDIMALATNDLGSLRMILSRGFNLITNTIILLVGSIIIMARHMDPRLTLYAILPFPILIFVMLRFGPMINKRFRRVQESFSDLTQKTQENISGIRVVKAFGQEGYEKENFDAINRDNFDINMALVRVQGVFYPLINLIASFSFLIAFVYGGNLIIDGKMTLGEFIAFNGYLGIIIRPITSIGMIVNFIQRAKASAQRIDELLDEEPDITDSGKFLEVQNSWKDGLKGRIEFRDLSFSYKKGSPMVLKNIDLNLEPGKTLGIIGKVGSGKSTIANLILRLYDPLSEDTLLIDGTDIREIPLKTLRQNIGYIPQDNFLFSASITENIGFNPEKPAMEEIRRAAQVSQVDEDIMGFKEGYETLLGERGVNLSGGQRQRVSIARALVKDPSILIMDDCLSAVDTNTEREILRELKTYTKDRTTIIIGHRISGIQHADEIIVLDEGRIIERGTHEELLAIKGYYNRIYLRQLLEEEIESA